MKYTEIKPKCETCLGCNRMLMADFKERYRCENYMRGEDDE